MNTIIEKMKWRYATKKFDSSRKVSNENLEILKEAINLSASSYGLQPYKVIVVENPETRKKLQEVAWGQAQVVDASHLLVFANQTQVTTEDIDALIENVSKTRNIPVEALSGYGDFMKSKITTLTPEQMNVWTSKQTYLALGNLLNAAAELEIDVTPMEGFDPVAVNEILGLEALGLNASLMAPIGYRHEEDALQFAAKVRKSNEELFLTL